MSDSGSVTISGGSGTTAITITNDYVQAHTDIFQSMTTAIMSYGPSTYSYPAGDTALIITSGQGDVTVTGIAASSAILVGDGTTLNYTGIGDASVFAGDGDDQVRTGDGNDVVALGGGHNSVTLGAGHNVVISAGTDEIFGGTGSASITLSGSYSTVTGGSGSMSIDDTAGVGTVIYASASLQLHGSNLGVTAVVGSGDSTVVGGTGGVSYTQTGGSLRYVGVGSSVASIDGGASAQSDALYAASGGSVFLSSAVHNNALVANDDRVGNGGSAVLDGSAATGGNQFWAGSGNATLIGGSGSDTLVAGLGHVTMTGGIGGANTFDIFKQSAGSTTSVTIADFGAASGNVITLFGYGASGVNAALSSAHQSGANTQLTLNDGTSITLSNFDATKLTHASFLST